MFNHLKTRLDRFEKRMRHNHGSDISTPEARRAAYWHFQLMDHAILRQVWTNLHEVAPGVWRSNQPDPKRLERYRDMGVKTVISLRADNASSPFLFEREACDELGLTLVTAPLQARKLVPAETLLHLLDLFERVEIPLVMHCKSGSDRAGLAAALYLLHIEGKPLAEARKQLSWRYLHLKNAPTGVLDHMLDAYEADISRAPIPIRDWIATRYDHAALDAEFRQKRGR